MWQNLPFLRGSSTSIGMGLFEPVLVMSAVIIVVLVITLNRAITEMWRTRKKKRIKRRGRWR